MAITGCSPDTGTSSLTDPDSAWNGGEVTGSGAPGSSPAAGQNIALWALPLDEFLPEYGNRENYAEQLLLASCLGDQNIEWPVPWQDVDEPASPVFNTAGRRLFDMDIAEKYGFRTNIELSRSAELWGEFISYQPTEAGFQSAFDTCLAGIREKYPPVSNENTMFVMNLVIQAQQDAFLKPDVQKAAEQWRSCAKTLGVGELPENPNDFPGEELLGELGAVPPLTSDLPSERENAIAVGHATCLDSSGFSKAMYAAEWDLQKTAIERERTKLDSIRDEVQARKVAVTEIIAANAPKA